MPGRKLRDGTFDDICFLLNAETRKMLEDRVIGEHKKLIREAAMPRALSAKV